MYEVYIDDSLIFRTGLEALQLSSAVLEKEVGKVDSFTFTIQPEHPFYDGLGRLKPVLTVWQDAALIFRGRILDIETDFYGAKTVTCEGDLAYLMDSIVRPYDFSDRDAVSPRELLTFFIDAHNEQTDEYKQFEIGAVTDEANATLTVEDSGYSTVWDALNDTLIDELGGYLYVTHVTEPDGSITSYINYVTDFASVASQKIEFGKNLTDITKTLTGEEIITGIIPTGEEIEVKDDDGNVTDRYTLTIESVNDGKDYLLDEEAAAKYGTIFASVKFDHVYDAEYLLTLAERYLEDAVKETATLEISAVDLALLDKSLASFTAGERVEVISEPHGIDDTYLVTKISVDLLSASSSKLTLGAEYKTLTEQAAEQNRAHGSLTLKMQQQLQKLENPSRNVETRDISLAGDWEAAEGYTAPYYYKTTDGMVYFSGALTGGSSVIDSVAFTLDGAFAPSSKMLFEVGGRTVEIGTDGSVTIEAGDTGDIIPLNSIFFRII